MQTKQKTSFACKICETKISFDINDSSTYLTKFPHERFFGMQLTSYRVAHTISSNRHINTVIVDHEGFFRGYIDAYSEPIIEESFVVEKVLHRFGRGNGKPLTEHDFFEILLLIDRQELWVLDIICPEVIKDLDLTKLILKNIQEAEKIYSDLPDTLTFNIADKTFSIWINGPRIFAGIRSSQKANSDIDAVLLEILSIYQENKGVRPNREVLIAIINAISQSSFQKWDIQLIEKVLTNPLLFSTIRIKYQDHIQRIAARLSKDFSIPHELLTPVLEGKITIINILQTRYFKEVLHMIDFVNRRKLLD